MGKRTVSVGFLLDGSVTLFFAMLFSLLVCFFLVLGGVAERSLAVTLGGRAVRSASRSVLAEFDRTLEEKYGFYAVQTPEKAEQSLRFYLKENLEQGGGVFLREWRVAESGLSVTENLGQPAAVKEQIGRFMELRTLTTLAEEAVHAFRALSSGMDEAMEQLSREAAENPEEQETEFDWALLEEQVFDKSTEALKEYAPDLDLFAEKGILLSSLPSHASREEDEADFPFLLQSLWERLREESARLLLKTETVLYLEGMLGNLSDTVDRSRGYVPKNMREKPKQNGFFRNEAEYVLKGSGNEYENIKAVRRRVIALRTIANVITLVGDEKRMELIKLAAESAGELVGGPIGEVGGLVGAVLVWAVVEADADWDELASGHSVPLIKKPAEWKTALIRGEEELAHGESSPFGLYYRDYLRLLLFTLPEDRLIGRLQDLIFLETEGEIPPGAYVTGFQVEGVLEAGWGRYRLRGNYAY